MIEVLTLIIGMGLGVFISQWADKIFFKKKFKGWTISCWKGDTAYSMWAKSDTDSVYVRLEDNGDVIIDYDAKSEK